MECGSDLETVISEYLEEIKPVHIPVQVTLQVNLSTILL